MRSSRATSPTPDVTLHQHMLTQMLRIRRVEEAIAQRYPHQEMRCPVHLSIGQEAVAVGVCQALEKNDVITCSHRAHAAYLAKGGDLSKMIAEIHGKATGCAQGRGGSMHLFDLDAGILASIAIVSSSIPLAVGAALGFKQQRKDHVAVAFFGDAAVEEGVFHESANFAAVHQLPIIFVCEDNQYSVYTPFHQRQPKRPLIALAQAHGLHGLEADGNDVVAVYETAQAAVTRARTGQGPSLLVYPTYRWLEHCGPNDDDHLGYRPSADVTQWRQRCPITLSEAALASQLPSDFLKTQEDAISAEIETAFTAAQQAPLPNSDTAWDYTYAS